MKRLALAAVGLGLVVSVGVTPTWAQGPTGATPTPFPTSGPTSTPDGPTSTPTPFPTGVTVGGIAEPPDLATRTGPSGMGSGTYAVLVGGVAFAVMGIFVVKRRGVQQ